MRPKKFAALETMNELSRKYSTRARRATERDNMVQSNIDPVLRTNRDSLILSAWLQAGGGSVAVKPKDDAAQ